MAKVYLHNAKNDTTYVYESISYWDKEKQQPRSRRTLIGKLDKVTGEIIPTEGRGKRKPKEKAPGDPVSKEKEEKDLEKLLEEKEKRIEVLEGIIEKYRTEMEGLLRELDEIRSRHSRP